MVKWWKMCPHRQGDYTTMYERLYMVLNREQPFLMSVVYGQCSPTSQPYIE